MTSMKVMQKYSIPTERNTLGNTRITTTMAEARSYLQMARVTKEPSETALFLATEYINLTLMGIKYMKVNLKMELCMDLAVLSLVLVKLFVALGIKGNKNGNFQYESPSEDTKF